MLKDDYIHKGLRKQMIEELISRGINNPDVLGAMSKLPRHWFIDDTFLKYAYQNRSFSIGKGQTISHPYTVAVQSDLLQVQQNDKILEIGTGSGYQACVLVEMGAKVYRIERQKDFYLKTKRLLKRIQYNKGIHMFFGDGYLGLADHAPFDKILITAAAPYAPKALLQQLKINGLMLLPINQGDNNQEMTLIKRNSETHFDISTHGNFNFVPMLKKTE